jgi:hypothetical protein
MATTTPNFGWPVPTSTDLVKDGATAIEALGDGIDTSLVDLKGGTTGQILAKATGADMDFAWITNDVGDITEVTAGTGITGGGTSGAVTVSFDQANFGGGQFAAGKNKIINGDFGIWQRGTSFTHTSGSTLFSADRFQYNSDGSGGSITLSRQNFTPGTAPVAGYEGTFFSRYACTTARTSQTYNLLFTKAEDVRLLAGQTATLSFWAKASSSVSINVTGQQDFGSGGSSPVPLTYGTAALTTSWTRFTFTLAIPSISGKTIGTSSNLTTIFGMVNTTGLSIDLWGVQLEAGSVATPFQTASGGSPQAELAMCQRYFQAIGGVSEQSLGSAFAYAATSAAAVVKFNGDMRTAPSISIGVGAVGDFQVFSAAAANLTLTNIAFQGISTYACRVLATVASGLVAGDGTELKTANTTGRLWASAEL